MPLVNGIECAELEDWPSQGSTLSEITLNYKEAYTGNGLSDADAESEVLAVNTNLGWTEQIPQGTHVFLPVSVYDIPANN